MNKFQRKIKRRFKMTKYFEKDKMNDASYQEVAIAIKEGKLVVFPTDTVYGIGTNAYDEQACEKIYEVKGRPMYKPLVVLISDISMLKKMVKNVTPVEQKLIDTFWPESLTIKFLKKENSFPNIISANDEYIRVRLTKKDPIHRLIEEAGVPVVAPSANISGSETGTKINNIINELGNKVDYILNYGDIESDIVSTIVQVEDEKIDMIREGKIKKKQLSKIAPIIEK